LTRGWERYTPLAIFLLAWAALSGMAGVYGWVGFGLLGSKLALSLIHKPSSGEDSDDGDDNEVVSVIVPVYNEDPELLGNCLRSIIEQTRVPDRIHVIDDGSADTSALDVARALLVEARARGIATDLTVFERNRGKREAQGVGFRASPEATVFLTVDSDTVLNPDALAEGLKPLADERVMCVTGMVMAINNDQNVLTRMIHLRYVNAFMWERAAYSQLGSVLCACGSLALYRAEVIHEHLDDFLTQRFLGKPAVFGDDRRLTNYSLLHGRAVLQPTAIARTAVPERLSHFLRQQLRWNKSFIRESVWVVQNMPLRSTPFWLTFLELASWIIFTLMLTLTMAVAGFHRGFSALAGYFALVCLISFVRSGHYFSAWDHHGGTVVSRLVTFLVAPLYGALHLLVLLPLRTVAALTMFSAGWGTRDRVEVRMDGTTFSAPLQPGGSERTPDVTSPEPALAARGAEVMAPLNRPAARPQGIEEALASWRQGEFARALGLLQGQLDGPAREIARHQLDALLAELDKIAEARKREYAGRFASGGDGWAELCSGFAAWARENLVRRPAEEHQIRTTRGVVLGEVEAVVCVRSATVVAAEALTHTWTRLWVDLDLVVRGDASLPEQLLMDCLRDGEIIELAAEGPADHVAARWEGPARIRVALDACVVTERRRLPNVIDLPRGEDRPAMPVA
jgi:hyaluronan synthase